MAPAFDEQVLTALDETDEVVLVATLDVPTLKNVKVAVETFDALHIAKDNRHLVLNRADDEVGINADKVEGILGMDVATQIASSLDVAAATNAGSPIDRERPRAPAQRGRARAGQPTWPARWSASRRRGASRRPSTPQSEAEAKGRRSRRRK